MMPRYDPIAFPHRDLTEKIIGAFFDVYRELGFGFLESVYHNAMLIALADAGLVAESEVRLLVHFRGHIVGEFDADIFVERKVIVEPQGGGFDFCPAHEAQTLNYLRASNLEVRLAAELRPETAHQAARLLERAEAVTPARSTRMTGFSN